MSSIYKMLSIKYTLMQIGMVGAIPINRNQSYSIGNNS